MTSFKSGEVIGIVSRREGLTQVSAKIGNDVFRATNYDDLTGDIKPGDSVVLNTTAVELGLGTGGSHFVLWNKRHESLALNRPGHIMKLRYTPLQLSCLSIEEQESPFHQKMKNSTDLRGMPVIVGTLHSQLPAVVATIKDLNPELRVSYVMTDGAALPLALSETVAELKAKKLIETTITCGNAFGGDFEAINIFSALVAAREAAKADICIALMGPGIVGTDTTLGYSGIEQGVILNAVGSLSGSPIAILRLHFADTRRRHYGISHHSLTALSVATLVKATVAVPNMSKDRQDLVHDQLKGSGVASKHTVVEVKDDLTLKALEKFGLHPTTMGRTVEEEPDFFRAAGAAGIHAVEYLERHAQ